MPGQIPNPTLIIHMTHVSNLPKIVASGGLLATATLQHSSVDYVNVAYSSIQQQRAAKLVPCGPGGSLHDYVPFYFARRSPMLYTINKGNVPCEGGQDNIIHLISTAQEVVSSGLGFVFSDGHGIMAYTRFYDDLDKLDSVDWDMIGAKYWHDTAEDGDRKRRKQAEFLVYGKFPLGKVSHVVVRSPERNQEVTEILNGVEHAPAIVTKSDWYY